MIQICLKNPHPHTQKLMKAIIVHNYRGPSQGRTRERVALARKAFPGQNGRLSFVNAQRDKKRLLQISAEAHRAKSAIKAHWRKCHLRKGPASARTRLGGWKGLYNVTLCRVAYKDFHFLRIEININGEHAWVDGSFPIEGDRSGKVAGLIRNVNVKTGRGDEKRSCDWNKIRDEALARWMRVNCMKMY